MRLKRTAVAFSIVVLVTNVMQKLHNHHNDMSSKAATGSAVGVSEDVLVHDTVVDLTASTVAVDEIR